MLKYPTGKEIVDEYLKIAKEAKEEGPEAYLRLGREIRNIPELALVLAMTKAYGALGLFIDGILIGMALSEKQQLEELAKHD